MFFILQFARKIYTPAFSCLINTNVTLLLTNVYNRHLRINRTTGEFSQNRVLCIHRPRKAGKIVTKIFRSSTKPAFSIIYLQRFIDFLLLYSNLKRLSQDSCSCYNININKHDSLADVNSTDCFYDETVRSCNR